MNSRALRFIAVPGLVGLLALTACGGDDSSGSSTTKAAETTAAPETTAAAETTAAGTETTAASSETLPGDTAMIVTALSASLGIDATEEQATCLATEALKNLTPEQLQELSSASGGSVPSKEAIKGVTDAMEKCIGTDAIVDSLAKLLVDPDTGVDQTMATCFADKVVNDMGLAEFVDLTQTAEEPPQVIRDYAKDCGIPASVFES